VGGIREGDTDKSQKRGGVGYGKGKDKYGSGDRRMGLIGVGARYTEGEGRGEGGNRGEGGSGDSAQGKKWTRGNTVWVAIKGGGGNKLEPGRKERVGKSGKEGKKGNGKQEGGKKRNKKGEDGGSRGEWKKNRERYARGKVSMEGRKREKDNKKGGRKLEGA